MKNCLMQTMEENHRYNLPGEAVIEILEKDRKQKMNHKQRKPHKVDLSEIKPLLEKLKEKYPVFKKLNLYARPLRQSFKKIILTSQKNKLLTSYGGIREVPNMFRKQFLKVITII